MKKTLLYILLILQLCILQSVAAQDLPTDKYYTDIWEYQINATGITLTGYRGQDKDLVIPSELDGEPVTQLEKELFINNTTLESVIIPGTVTAVGANAFNGCTALREVQLSFIMTRIESGLFRYCVNLEQITLPRTVTFIGSYAFADCFKLREITMLSVTSVGESAFENCHSLTSIHYGNRLSTVNGHALRNSAWLSAQKDEFVYFGKGLLIKYNGSDEHVEVPYSTVRVMDAFEDNLTVKSVHLPETVRQIGQYAFKGAVNLEQINVPQYVTAIGASAFEGCSSLREIELPRSVKSFGAAAFRSCPALEHFSIPPETATIPANLFANCTALTDVYIPPSVTKVNNVNAFLNDDNLTLHVIKNSDAEKFARENEIPYLYILQASDEFLYRRNSSGIEIVRYLGNLYDVEVPAEIDGFAVTAIGTAAFQNNSNVKRVILPVNVKSIGDWAFSYMDSLEFVQIPEGLKFVGNNAFTGSQRIKELKLSRRQAEIGTQPFDDNAMIMICAQANSSTMQTLTEMGYHPAPLAACADDDIMLASWADQNYLSQAPTVCGDDCGASSDASGDWEVIRIPEGIINLRASLIDYAGTNVYLFIPDTVIEIDPAILDGRTVIIVGKSGSAAEAFAREYGVRFTVELNTWVG